MKRLRSWCKTLTRVLSGGQPAVKQEPSRATVGIPLVYEGEDVNSNVLPHAGHLRGDVIDETSDDE